MPETIGNVYLNIPFKTYQCKYELSLIKTFLAINSIVEEKTQCCTPAPWETSGDSDSCSEQVMGKGLCLGHAGVNHEMPQKSGQLHRFLSLRDPKNPDIFGISLRV